MKYRLSVRAPITVSLAALCVAAMLLQSLSVFSDRTLALLPPRYWRRPIEVVRVLTWCLSHADWSHLMNNLPTLLLLGPSLERRLGVARYALVMLAVAVVGAACHFVTSPDEGLHGLSGVVFALLMLAGGEHVRRMVGPGGGMVVDVPVAYALLAALFSWQELSQWWSGPRTVARLAHAVGGAIGAAAAVAFGRVERPH